MTDYAIRVEGLCKEYVIGGREEVDRTFRESITDAIAAPLRRLRAIGQEPPPEERFWALKDVSFEVKPGEVVGIIGRNGAGKSTLLKILSRITAPTKGRVEIRGRVASLLEVGTGFHPELTGRENIYLNGAILGMSRAEITRKFDEIVAFAEVEKFLDTPVKRYSSGMYVRLAFAVAAHLEPEILIVDEVLAVGDAEFQKKCLGKMGEVAKQGRTVLFVSHNLRAILRLCSQALLLSGGQPKFYGAVQDCVDRYLSTSEVDSLHMGAITVIPSKSHAVSDNFSFESINIEAANGDILRSERFSSPLNIEVTFSITRNVTELIIGIGVQTLDEFAILTSHSDDLRDPYTLAPGTYAVTISFAPNYLRPGNYLLSLKATSRGRTLAHVAAAARLEVASVSMDYRTGVVSIPMSWSAARRL